MKPFTDLPLDRPFPDRSQRREAVVQDRPTLGSMPRTSRSIGWWLLPVVDLISSSLTLALVALLTGASLFPALPVAPLLLVIVYGVLGVYGASPARTAEDGRAWPVIRLLVAALFVWVASLLTTLDGPAQLALWAGFVVLDTIARRAGAPLFQRFERPERWVLVGAEATAERLRAYEPLREYAQVVATVSPNGDASQAAARVAALEVVERYSADRVVIASQYADDEGLLERVRAFKSIGVPVSLLPRPLDLLEAPAATPSKVGGVPLIDVEALATRGAVPYAGPDRRRSRKTLVTVVVPAMNEEWNIGQVLSRLPDDLHEVILVDGNSQDGTIEAARTRLPRHPCTDPERARQGRRLPHRLRRRHRQPRRDARRRRLGRPGGDPALRRGAGGRRRLRQGLALPARRRQRRHHQTAPAWATPSSAARPTSCTAPASPTSATATTPSGPAACRSSRSTCPASRSRR